MERIDADWLDRMGDELASYPVLAYDRDRPEPATAASLLPMIDPASWEGLPVPAREWVLDGWIPARQATYLTGPGSAGKSLAAQMLATCVALGLSFLGIQTRQAVSLYVTCEDDVSELHRRQVAICEALCVPLSAVSGKLLLSSLVGEMGMELCTFRENGTLERTPRVKAIAEVAKQAGIGFIALDNTAHLFSGNENDRHQVASFVMLLNRLAIHLDAAVLLIGHPNKAGDSFSGSTAWSNQVRSRLFLDVVKDDAGNITDPDARQLSREKANYARNGETLTFRWHKGAFVRDTDLPPDTAAEMRETIAANADNAVFLACLAERTRQQRAVSEKVGRNLAPVVFAAMPEGKRVGKARLDAAMDRLFRIGRIERAELWKGPDRKPVIGLREVRETGAGNGAETRCGNAENHRAETREEHTPYTTYREGGAFAGPPPSNDDGDIVWDDEGSVE